MKQEPASGIGARVRQAREALHLTQEELADQMGFASRQILSELERGRRDVKVAELARLARALRIEVSALLDSAEPAARPTVLWRARPLAEAEHVQAEFLTWCERYAYVMSATGGGQRKRDRLPNIKLEKQELSYSTVEELAAEIGSMLDLGSRPASSIQRAIETQFDVIVWYLDLGRDGSAACTKGSFGAAMLVNRSEAPWRRNFDVAHELFHLLTWDSLNPMIATDHSIAAQAERLANSFAAGLLLPAEPLRTAMKARAEDGLVALADLVAVARDFDVSTEALLWRLFNIGLGFDHDQVRALLADRNLRQLDRSSMVGRWWQPPSLPERFVRLAYLAVVRGRLSRAKLAQYLDCGLMDLADRLEEYGIVEQEGEGLRIVDAPRDFDLNEVPGGEAEVYPA